jgi:hypothetical protein
MDAGSGSRGRGAGLRRARGGISTVKLQVGPGTASRVRTLALIDSDGAAAGGREPACCSGDCQAEQSRCAGPGQPGTDCSPAALRAAAPAGTESDRDRPGRRTLSRLARPGTRSERLSAGELR